MSLVLDEWSLTNWNSAMNWVPIGWKSPLRVKGRIYNHPVFVDGEMVLTSDIQLIGATPRIVVTRNTLYRLREPSEKTREYLNRVGLSVEEYLKVISEEIKNASAGISEPQSVQEGPVLHPVPNQ